MVSAVNLIEKINSLLTEEAFQQAQHTVDSSDPDHKAMLGHLKKNATATPFGKHLTSYNMHDSSGTNHSFMHSKIKGENSGITSSFSSLQHLRNKATGNVPAFK